MSAWQHPAVSPTSAWCHHSALPTVATVPLTSRLPSAVQQAWEGPQSKATRMGDWWGGHSPAFRDSETSDGTHCPMPTISKSQRNYLLPLERGKCPAAPEHKALFPLENSRPRKMPAPKNPKSFPSHAWKHRHGLPTGPCGGPGHYEMTPLSRRQVCAEQRWRSEAASLS